MFECYENVIGLTDKNCACDATGRPVNYNTSLSGLYLSQLMEIGNLINMGECDDDMWTILTESVTHATSTLVTETNALLQKAYTLKRQPALGQFIGEIKASDTVTPTKNYGVVRINCCPIRSGIMTITGLGTVFSATGSFDVMIYNNVDGLLQTVTVNTTANKNTKNTQSIELPTFSKYVDQLEYYLVFLFDALNLPKDTEVDCGCGSWTPMFDLGKPHYMPKYGRTVGKKLFWTKYVMVGGLEINSLTELDDLDEELSTLGNNMYGLNLELDFSCKVSEVLCKDTLDFVGNPLAYSLAYALLYLSASLIADRVMSSNKLSRETLVNFEQWAASKELWHEKYMEYVNFIVDNIDLTSNDCLTCKDVLEMTRQGLFS